MSVLYLVRHGQASFGAANYDKLSELGERQMRALGKYWVDWGLKIDAVYSGTLDRQTKSAACAQEAFLAAHKKFPDPVIVPDLNEYETRHLLGASISTVLAEHPEIAKLAKELSASGPVDLAANKKAFQKIFAAAMDLWVDEKLSLPGMETWRQFTTRVNAGIDRVIKEQASGKTVAVFTSGGPVSAAVQRAMKCDDKTALELGWVIANGSITEFRFSGDKFSLATFNATPHLSEPALVSYR
jgi:broad specificity phosphatase PhoE